MSNAAFRFKVGKLRCMVVSDGTLSPSTGPAGQPGAQTADVDYLNCLLIDTDEYKILVDTGCGDGFQATAGKLVKNLEAEGIKPGDVEKIIFTHGHLDHVAGAFDEKGKPVFPNAHYLAYKKEWDYWAAGRYENEIQVMLFASARRNLLPILQHFDLVEENAEALPGIKFKAAPGHTPGNSVLEITSNSDRLLCIGDVIHSPKEFVIPDCYSAFDVVPGQALQTRNKILSRAAGSGELVFACHFPFPGLGYVGRANGIFSWKPLKTGL
jgi:glyoxylase-like metal-dependent hydrolase (beta-lactamase superfamily II)